MVRGVQAGLPVASADLSDLRANFPYTVCMDTPQSGPTIDGLFQLIMLDVQMVSPFLPESVVSNNDATGNGTSGATAKTTVSGSAPTGADPTLTSLVVDVSDAGQGARFTYKPLFPHWFASDSLSEWRQFTLSFIATYANGIRVRSFPGPGCTMDLKLTFRRADSGGEGASGGCCQPGTAGRPCKRARTY